MSTKYNVLYNGNIAFDEAKENLDKAYEDNFWERLPIEPLKIEEDFIPMPGQSVAVNKEPEGFEKAEEKAVKAIQKHSMVFDGHEKNKQIDEAYLLLGKSRYFLQRFVPALEAFSFALDKYPDANLYDETRIWKAKAQLRLQNEELAIQTLDYVLKDIDILEETFENAHTAMAMAYTQLDSIDKVMEHLKKSTYYFSNRSQSARNFFILGQIYREKQEIDSSNMVFDALTNMKKIPQKYKVHAALERAKNYSKADSTSIITYVLQDLIEDRDNRAYLDELYYQAGLIAQKNGNLENANYFYRSSVFYNKTKPFQKSLSYEKLGDLYFDKSEFETAGAYYDSVLAIPKLDQNTKRMRKIIRKNESLNDVIYYENIVKRNDSILTLTKMPEIEQKIYFEKYIEALKIKDLAEKERLENIKANTGGLGTNELLSRANPAMDNNTGSSFYFYNTQSVGFGKQEFKNIYGNRPLTDNWLISGVSGETRADITGTDKNLALSDSLKYDIHFYMDQIPVSANKIDSIFNQRSDAYYNLGLIYKEQFKEYDLATLNFETYLKNKPKENLILPTKYHLYKSYANFNDNLSNKYRDEIVMEYPDSRYAEIIQNPRDILDNQNDEESPEYIYKNAFVCYEDGDYTWALKNVNDGLEKFKGLEIEAKFELLNAFLLYKTKGDNAFVEKLNFVIVNYPNTEESEHAQKVLDKLQNKEAEKK